MKTKKSQKCEAITSLGERCPNKGRPIAGACEAILCRKHSQLAVVRVVKAGDPVHLV